MQPSSRRLCAGASLAVFVAVASSSAGCSSSSSSPPTATQDGSAPSSDAGATDATSQPSSDSGGSNDSSTPIESGTDGGGVVTAACTACMTTSCQGTPDTYTACTGNTGCTPLLACWAGCGAYDGVVSSCETNCGAAHTSAIAEGSNLGDCAARQCGTDCPWAFPLGACNKCVFAADPADIDTCYGDTTCLTWYTCVLQSDDLTSFEACGSGDGTSQSLLNTMQGTCESACQTP